MNLNSLSPPVKILHKVDCFIPIILLENLTKIFKPISYKIQSDQGLNESIQIESCKNLCSHFWRLLSRKNNLIKSSQIIFLLYHENFQKSINYTKRWIIFSLKTGNNSL